MRLLSIQRLALGMLLAVGIGPIAACSESAEDAERRGLVVEPEVAAPESPRELSETEAERRAQSQAELAREEKKRFEEAEERARNPAPEPTP